MAYDEQSAALEIARLRKELAAAQDRIASLEQQLAEALSALSEAQRIAARQAAPFRRDKEKKVPPGERKRPGRKPGHRGAYRSDLRGT